MLISYAYLYTILQHFWIFVSAFIYLLRAYYVSSTILGSGAVTMNKIDKKLCLHGANVQVSFKTQLTQLSVKINTHILIISLKSQLLYEYESFTQNFSF